MYPIARNKVSIILKETLNNKVQVFIYIVRENLSS